MSILLRLCKHVGAVCPPFFPRELQAPLASSHFAACCRTCFPARPGVENPSRAEFEDHKTCLACPARPERWSSGRVGRARGTPPSGRTRRAQSGARAEQWGWRGAESRAPSSCPRRPPRPAARPCRSLPPGRRCRPAPRLSLQGWPSLARLGHPGSPCGHSRFLCGCLPAIFETLYKISFFLPFRCG